ncbi:GIY-YIG nuclease family protein [Parendozoicomonas sp. Alg238-R29]|uniref:GIY-YIG nuclease family protein n=1 Tax=Parendozoicomonas sp. Alg238-R29 TaxID=2993446 RepID=UPI00248E276C|nr:GIY-YIG nuclease family protein [Parendozoicomonas sp. Alg238-R29]
MIIFTVTNTITHQVYVGSTRNDLDAQWERMVAAAEQNLDFPLYRDIRTYGCDAFIREIYDMADSRQELAELEQDALETLNAISLRGHKTSVVVIKKKTPVRRKKSEAEKELLDLLDTFATDSDNATDDTPTEQTKAKVSEEAKPAEAKGRVIKAEAPAQPAIKQKTSIPKAAKPTATKSFSTNSSFDAVAAAKAILAAAAKEEDQKAAAQPKPVDPKRTSRTTGNVKLDVSIDDTINAQLAAITAAVDGVLAGNAQAASQLETQKRTQPVEADSLSEAPKAFQQTEASAEEPTEPETIEQPLEKPAKVFSEKELRLIEAMERHRELRVKRTSDVIDAEKNQIKELLAELNNRVASMPVDTAALYH